jgi:Tol biopolymer transport system component
VLAYRFDPERLDTPGEPTLLAADLLSAGESSEEFDRTFSVSRAGVVVYRASTRHDVQLAWVKRDGTLLGQVGGRLSTNNFALSPDERRVAVEVNLPGDEGGVFILDLIRGTTVPFESRVNNPIWSPDASEIMFTRTVNPGRTGAKSPSRLFRKSTLHDGPAVPVLPAETHEGAQIWAKHWSADGRTLVYLIQTEGRNQAYSLRLDRESAPVTLGLAFEVFDALRLSPDGRLLAYLVLDRGREDVFVQPFAGPGERVRVTPDGGGQPQWRADGKELYYVTRTGTLMAVSIDPQGRLDAKPARPLFEIPVPTAMWTQEYAPSKDGQRFLVTLPQQTGVSTLRVVSGWQPVADRRTLP